VRGVGCRWNNREPGKLLLRARTNLVELRLERCEDLLRLRHRLVRKTVLASEERFVVLG
jgi:hypothetical protein